MNGVWWRKESEKWATRGGGELEAASQVLIARRHFSNCSVDPIHFSNLTPIHFLIRLQLDSKWVCLVPWIGSVCFASLVLRTSLVALAFIHSLPAFPPLIAFFFRPSSTRLPNRTLLPPSPLLPPAPPLPPPATFPAFPCSPRSSRCFPTTGLCYSTKAPLEESSSIRGRQE